MLEEQGFPRLNQGLHQADESGRFGEEKIHWLVQLVDPQQLQVLDETAAGTSGATIMSCINATSLGARLRFRRSHGTFAAPTTVAVQDTIAQINFMAHSGSSYINGQQFSAVVDDAATLDATHVGVNLLFMATGTGTTLSVGSLAAQVQSAFFYSGDAIFGFNNILTTATTGFVWLRTCNGPPTGVPVVPARLGNASAAMAMVVDATNARLYARAAGAWQFSPFGTLAAHADTKLDDAVPAQEQRLLKG